MCPKIAYVPKNFRGAARKTIDQANAIINSYLAQGYDLTLRQLYYQFVSRGFIPNNMQSYKNLGSVINDARLAGLIDWNAVTDRTRNMQQNSHWSDPADIIKSAALGYAIDKWDGQEYRPEVWVEKEALAGIVAQAAYPLDVPYFSCRGYVSQSEMWSAAMRLRRHMHSGQIPLIIHLGDHDPSGIDMTRDIMDRMEMFIGPVEVKRIALNLDQIEQYNPPPNPAKLTDSRVMNYIRLYGDESWELDALEPTVLTQLIQDTIIAHRDDTLWEEKQAEEAEQRRELEAVSDRWDDVAEFVS